MPAKKTGRPPTKVTSKMRQRLTLGIATGLRLPELAAATGLPESTMRRVLASEIKSARTTVLLDNLQRLDRAARRGNISAARSLLKMVMAAQPYEVEVDRWANVSAPAVLGENRELH